MGVVALRGKRSRSLAAAIVLLLAQVVTVLQALPAQAEPSNDAFAAATAITALPFEVSGNIADATLEPGEPTNCFGGERRRTVWFRLAPTTTTGVFFDIDQFGVSIFLSVYRGETLPELECIGAKFDEYAFKARAGTTYWFQLWVNEAFANNHPPSNPIGPYTVRASEIPVAANDDLADATQIAVPFLDRPDLLGSTIEGGEHLCGFETGTVWYRYTNATGRAEGLIVNPMESWFPGPWIGVYTGSGGPDLLIACSRIWNRPVGFRALPGESYWIQVGSDEADNTYFDYPISIEVAHGRVVHGPADPILGIPITTTYVQQDGRHTGAGVFSNHTFEYGGAWADTSNRSAGGCAWVGDVSDPFTSPCVEIG